MSAFSSTSLMSSSSSSLSSPPQKYVRRKGWTNQVDAATQQSTMAPIKLQSQRQQRQTKTPSSVWKSASDSFIVTPHKHTATIKEEENDETNAPSSSVFSGYSSYTSNQNPAQIPTSSEDANSSSSATTTYTWSSSQQQQSHPYDYHQSEEEEEVVINASSCMDVDTPTIPSTPNIQSIGEEEEEDVFESTWRKLRQDMQQQQQPSSQQPYFFQDITTRTFKQQQPSFITSSKTNDDNCMVTDGDTHDVTKEEEEDFILPPVETQLDLELCNMCKMPLSFVNLYGSSLTCSNESCPAYKAYVKPIVHPSSALATMQYFFNANNDDDDGGGGITNTAIVATSFNSSFSSNHVAFLGHYTKGNSISSSSSNNPTAATTTSLSSPLSKSLAFAKTNTTISSPPHQLHPDASFLANKRVWPEQSITDYIAVCIRLSLNKVNMSDVTVLDICACAKAHSWKELYKENAIQLYCRITNTIPPHLTPKQKRVVNDLFDQLYMPYAQNVQHLQTLTTTQQLQLPSVNLTLSTKKRPSNRINHVFLWYRVYQLTGIDHMLKFLKLPTTIDTLAICIEAFDQMMQERKEDDELKQHYDLELKPQNATLLKCWTQSIDIKPLIGVGAKALAESKLDVLLDTRGNVLSIKINGEEVNIDEYRIKSNNASRSRALAKLQPIINTPQPITMTETDLARRLKTFTSSSSSSIPSTTRSNQSSLF